MTILLHIAIGGLLSIAVLVLMSLESTKNVGTGLKWGFMIIPSFSMCFGICDISFRDLFALVNKWDPYSPMDLWCGGGEALFLGIGAIIWTVLHILLESGILRRKVQADKIGRSEFEVLDDDVENENNWCQNLSKEGQSVLIWNLVKVYNHQGR